MADEGPDRREVPLALDFAGPPQKEQNAAATHSTDSALSQMHLEHSTEPAHLQRIADAAQRAPALSGLIQRIFKWHPTRVSKQYKYANTRKVNRQQLSIEGSDGRRVHSRQLLPRTGARTDADNACTFEALNLNSNEGALRGVGGGVAASAESDTLPLLHSEVLAGNALRVKQLATGVQMCMLLLMYMLKSMFI